MPFARSGRPGLLGTVARTATISGTAQARADESSRRSAHGELGAALPAATARNAGPSVRTPPPVSPPPAGGGELADQLFRLADLHSSGLLTDDEFAAAKARILM